MGRVQTGMAFCKPPPAEQQHLEEVQKQRADNQQRAAEAPSTSASRVARKDAFGMHSILSKARTKQQENKRPDRERKKTRSRCNWHPAVIIPVLESRSLQMCWQEG